MAGAGSRFKEAGFDCEKYEIMFHGKTLFEWSLSSLKNFYEYQFIFISLDFPNIAEFLKEKNERLGITDWKHVIINELTRGQAETVLMAEPYLTDDDGVLIFNIDTYVDPQFLNPENVHGNGWVPVFIEEGDRWSFMRVDEDDLVIETTEKVRISDWCSVGAYYFDCYSKFKEIVLNRLNQFDELYIAPLYNDFITKGNSVYIHKIPNEMVLILGTPADLIMADKKLSNIKY